MNLEQFGHRLEARLKDVPAAEAEAIREEVMAQLDASIQARLELGATPDQAERLAVAEFGDLLMFSRGLEAVKSRSTHRWTLACTALIPILPMANFVLTDGRVSDWMKWFECALLITIAALASRQRRWNFRPSLIGGVMGAVLASTLIFTAYMPVSWSPDAQGDNPLVQRWSYESEIQALDAQLPELKARLLLVNEGISASRGHEGMLAAKVQLLKGGSWIIPTAGGIGETPRARPFELAANESGAQERWRRQGSALRAETQMALRRQHTLRHDVTAYENLSLVTKVAQFSWLSLKASFLTSLCSMACSFIGFVAGLLVRRRNRSGRGFSV